MVNFNLIVFFLFDSQKNKRKDENFSRVFFLVPEEVSLDPKNGEFGLKYRKLQ